MIYEMALVSPAALAVCFVLMAGKSEDEARRVMYSVASIFSMFVLAGMTVLFLSSSETLSVYTPAYSVVITNSSGSGNIIVNTPAYYSNTIYPAFSSGAEQAGGLMLLVEVIFVLIIVFLVVDIIFIKPWQQKRRR